MRKSKLSRKSKESNISIKLNVDGKGRSKIKTPINFLNHMLESFTKHGAFDLEITASGDTHIDQHHTVEDIGIVLGKAFKEALKDKKGINRAGSFAFPLDESLSIVAIDLSGRPYLRKKLNFTKEKIGDLESDTISEFFSGFSMGSSSNVHIIIPYGENNHHKAESLFKAFGKALDIATSKNPKTKNLIPTTKELLDNL